MIADPILPLACLPLLLAGCATAATDSPAPSASPTYDFAAPAAPVPPRGARIERSGYATILTAPPRPYPAEAPPSDRGEAEPQRLARELGISVAEAELRMNPDQDSRRAAVALRDRLRSAARGNFVDMRIVRDSLPRFVFYFRRDAAATFARFTSDPRFQAVDGGVPEEELRPLFEEWLQRFGKHRLVGTGSVRHFEGDVEFELAVSRSEYEEIALREGWRPPPQVKLNFAREVDSASAMAPDLAPFVRAFPRADRSPGIILTSATYGRIILRDGCLRLERGRGGVEPLVLFGRETRLQRDSEGYVEVRSLGNRDEGGRIGERMVWGGYPPAVESEAGVRELRARCGSDPIVSIGEPTSAYQFRVRPWAIDEYAAARRITRQQAWNEIKACWAEQDTITVGGRPAPQRDCDTPYRR